MRRIFTARKLSTLDESAIDAEKFGEAFPVSRADMDPVATRKLVARFLATYGLLWLPVHCAICWLWSLSPALATGAVAVVTIGSFVFATAKWLGLEDLLQKLPLLVLLGLLLLGLGYFSSRPNMSWMMGPESLGFFLAAVTAISILSSLYRPLAAAYETVTMKLPWRDLAVAGTAIITSLAIAGLGHIAHWFLFALLASTATGIYAGLVVIEYAAWTRANPNADLRRALAFKTSGSSGDKKESQDPLADLTWPAFGAACVGFGYAIFTVLLSNIPAPSPELCRLLVRLANDQPEDARAIFATLFLTGLSIMAVGFYIFASRLNAFRFEDPRLAPRVALNAIVVFLAYGDPKNPLVHRLRIPWLRPLSVRLAITGVVLTAIATTAFQPAWQAPKKRSESNLKKLPPTVLVGDDFFNHQLEAIPPFVAPPPVPEETSTENGIGPWLVTAVSVLLVPPTFVYLMVWMVGFTVLPTYFNYFERPEVSNNASAATPRDTLEEC
jgi:hypothetical protein